MVTVICLKTVPFRGKHNDLNKAVRFVNIFLGYYLHRPAHYLAITFQSAVLTNSMAYETRRFIAEFTGLFNNTYPEPNQPNYQLFLQGPF